MNNVHLKFSPEDGMEVRLLGNVTIYEKRGQVQLRVSIMESQGLGELHKTFEALKQSLEKEGLFEEVHKKKIPPYPNRIGVLTSGSGAAYRDILNVLNRRAPQVNSILHSVKVQGKGSSQEIASGIELFNSHNSVDVIIVARGGGSIEDLWAFNDEKVARSIFSSAIPIITGIGHQTDFTIADFVSDLRAPTPSVAAEIAAPHRDELLSELSNYRTKMLRIVQGQLEQRWLLFDQIEKRIAIQSPTKKIKNQIFDLDQIKNRIQKAFLKKEEILSEQISHLSKQLSSLGPYQVLERGYAIPIDENGSIIRSSSHIDLGQTFKLKMAKDSFIAKKTSDIKDE
tara:strand:- start:2518 stop:3540 length:1023 start_codon:yes stop_codon:yes gene_type:complete